MSMNPTRKATTITRKKRMMLTTPYNRPPESRVTHKSNNNAVNVVAIAKKTAANYAATNAAKKLAANYAANAAAKKETYKMYNILGLNPYGLRNQQNIYNKLNTASKMGMGAYQNEIERQRELNDKETRANGGRRRHRTHRRKTHAKRK